jgi:hypothetical protein
MAELKTYTVTCPDPDCAEEFTIQRDPETLGDDGELIQCPACGEEWEWEHEAGFITLLPDFDLEDDEDEDEDDEDDEYEDLA